MSSPPPQPRPSKRRRPPLPPPPVPAPAPATTAASADASSELLASRADLSSRPILSISRHPIFTPNTDDTPYFRTDSIGINRVGFRYVPAGINPPGFATPCRTIESNPTALRLSWEDRSPFLRLTKDALAVIGANGFRSARCNAPFREGRWYMEVTVVHGGGEQHLPGEEQKHDGAHVRLGWGRREAPLNGPVGADGYSYGYRDRTGDKVTLSRPRPYGRPYGSGDVVGMYISLPPRRAADPNDLFDPAHKKRERIPIDLKGQEMFEMLEYPPSKEMITLMDYAGKSPSTASLPSFSKKTAAGKLPERAGRISNSKVPSAPPLRPLPTLHGSRIAFFVNGECEGTAFADIYDFLPLHQSGAQRAAKEKEKKRTREGVKEHRENPYDDGTLGYYPFISLFNDACVRLNPGPDFSFSPPPDIDALLDARPILADAPRTWRPACERYPEFMQEQWALDALEEEQAKRDLAREKAEEDRKLQRAEAAEARLKARKLERQALTQLNTELVKVENGAEGANVVDDDRFGPTAVMAASLVRPVPSSLKLEVGGGGEEESLLQGEASSLPSQWAIPCGDFAGPEEVDLEAEATAVHVPGESGIDATASAQTI